MVSVVLVHSQPRHCSVAQQQQQLKKMQATRAVTHRKRHDDALDQLQEGPLGCRRRSRRGRSCLGARAAQQVLDWLETR